MSGETDNTPDAEGQNATACPTCGRTFKTTGGMKVHHNHAHGERLGVVTVSCSNCGVEFEKRSDHAERHDNHFCSNNCDGEWKSKNLSGRDNPQYSKVHTDCSWCGADLRVRNRKYEIHEDHFCSDECLAQHRSKRAPEPDYDSRECTVCGELVHRYPSHFYDSGVVLCSNSCESKWKQQVMSGEKNPSWSGGRVPYGPGWNKRKRQQVRERDSYTCQNAGCSVTQEDHLNRYGEKLHVHHLKKARDIDDPEARNAKENLITLCCECHPQWEKIANAKLIPQFAGVLDESAHNGDNL